jgi:phage terminase small subunit|nr:MAG TPA: Terminase small subunit [Caudoviricetes sp.]
MSDEKLTPKQRRFCEEYLKSGNATEAAKKAGYKEKAAHSMGAENLRKPAISAYIKHRTDEQEAALVADSNEILKFYTAVMRGEVKDQFGMDASLSDRLKAGDSLMKRYAAASDRNRTTMEKLDSMLKEFQDAVKSEAT